MTAIEVVGGRATNPGAGPTALTPNTGNSFAVRNTSLGTKVFLDGIWCKEATAGFIRVRSPRLHDNVQGIRYQVAVNQQFNLMGDYPRTILIPQDTLTFEIGGGAAETDTACLLIAYEDLPGSNGRFATWGQVLPRIVDLVTNEVSVAGAATIGDWSAGTPINATNDLLKANTDYAVIGYVCQNSVTAVALQGPDVGGLRVGGPGTTNTLETREWFRRQDVALDIPYIPIINSANKGGTLAFQMDSAAGAANLVDFLLAELSPGGF
jgi:hypothetical protein